MRTEARRAHTHIIAQTLYIRNISPIAYAVSNGVRKKRRDRALKLQNLCRGSEP